MAVSSTNVSISAVKAALGVSTNTVSGLCMSGNINKWSLHKPVRHTKMGGLSGDDWKGDPTEIANGYVYGVKLAGAQSDFTSLHNVNFEYHQVTTAWPRRLGDFRGYDPNARANLDGFCPSTGTASNYGFAVNMYYNPGDQGGIDYASVVGNVSNAYPCILLSSGSNHYAQALILDSTGFPAPLQSGSRYNSDYHCKLDNFPVYAVGSWKATVFLLTPQNGDPFSFNGSWNDVSTSRGPIWLSKPFAVPSCVNITMGITVADNTPVATPTLALSTLRGVAFQYTLSPSATETLNLEVVVEGGNTVTKTMNLLVGGEQQTSRFTWDELGMAYASGMMATVYVTIKTKKSSSSTWKSGPRTRIDFTM